ncbi:ABC transporter ATP-binding protein [Labrys wisconsinensis]|uniref:ATP-binding cassette subfamily B protein n=1 Tax=Labrys wisconsinensis TaxID=425677 RepID=A0ABU0J9C8_9HYPH|nr:ABC transporter ATP-binding protein [Labrys wisconsinensis]MDQ0470873.1 ATP-binding cassette subfamily B protein [Labrys wisconsinensis]
MRAISSLTDTGPSALALLSRMIREEGRRHVPSYAFAFVCMGVTAAATGLSAYLMRDVINQLFVDRNQSAIIWLGVAVVAIYLAKGLGSYGQDTTMARIGNRIIAGVQTRMFEHLLRQDLGFFTGTHSTQLIAQNSFIAVSARNSLNLVVTSIGRDLMSLIALTTVMVVQDPLLSLAALVIMPPAVLGARYLTRRVRGVAQRQYEGSAQIVAALQETAQGVRVVKSFGLEEVMLQRMGSAIAHFQRAANKIAELASRSSPLMETLGGMAVAVVIIYSGWRVIAGGQTPGAFFSFLTALLLAYEPAKRLAKFNVDLNAALAGVRMYFDFLDSPTAEGPAEAAKPPLAVSAGRIAFEDVTFGYRADEPVLRGVSFVAEAGRTTALVGQSGGGKSTIMNMIPRFYDPDGGRVAIDGQDVSAVSLPSLRGAIAYVGQDVFLFAGTIRENIAFGHLGASEEDVVAAAKAAHAHDFILGFELGYDTPVGERGLQLSGGQRARITIARAVLRHAPIVLLDEATAALDSESEVAVQTALDELSTGRTTIVIAHRLQTVQRADRICVVEGGRVVEEGRHEELLARRGRYFHLHAMQFRDEGERRPGRQATA